MMFGVLPWRHLRAGAGRPLASPPMTSPLMTTRTRTRTRPLPRPPTANSLLLPLIRQGTTGHTPVSAFVLPSWHVAHVAEHRGSMSHPPPI